MSKTAKTVTVRLVSPTTAEPKIMTVRIDKDATTLAALAQILVPDEINLLVALAAREKCSVTRFARLALRRDMFGSLDCAQQDAADGLHSGETKEYAKLVPLADKLGWLSEGSFPEN